MEQDNKNRKGAPVFSKKLRAGRRRTYFFDIRPTKSNDFYLTITESKKRYNEDGYDRHKIFLYKEDFNKFIEALHQAIDHVKTELLPDYDFDEFSHRDDDEYDYDNDSGDMPSKRDVGVADTDNTTAAQQDIDQNKNAEEDASPPKEDDEDLKWD